MFYLFINTAFSTIFTSKTFHTLNEFLYEHQNMIYYQSKNDKKPRFFNKADKFVLIYYPLPSVHHAQNLVEF